MKKWQRATLAAVLAAATVGGVASVSAAVNAKPVTTRSVGQRTAFPARGSVARNIRIVETFLRDVLDEHHGDHAANYLTADAQFHAGTVGNFAGRATVAAVLASVVAGVPDLHANVQDIFGYGNEVVVRLVVTGTQQGPLLGIPATGRHLQWDAIDLYRLRGGKISQEWASEDLTAILNDTGTYKAPWIHLSAACSRTHARRASLAQRTHGDVVGATTPFARSRARAG
jgi:predicted ester cyclase